MRYYFAILKWTFKITISYKWNHIISFLLNPVILLVYIFLFQTIYRYDSSQMILGYTCTQMIWYYAAITFFYCFIWCEPDKDISEEIISGSIAIRLTRPVSVLKTFFANAAATKLQHIPFIFLPNFLIYSLIIFPDFLTVTAFFKYLVISVFSFILFYLIGFLLGTTAFQLQNITTLRSIKTSLVLMAGVFIPLDFLPKVFQSIVKALPFQYIYYVPVQFFLNKPETQGLDYFLQVISAQLIWIGVFYLLCLVCWRMALKHFYAVGG